jgi:hypothetical protein
MYSKEKGVDDALRALGIDRADVFITSKLNNGFHEPDGARKAFAQTLTELEPGDAEKIDALNKGEAGRDGPNPDVFGYVPSWASARTAKPQSFALKPDR